MVLRVWRPMVVMAVALVVAVGLSAPLTPYNAVDAAGDRFAVSNWTDSNNKVHRIRWNPCQAAVTYAVNPWLSGRTAEARRGAVADTRAAFRRVSHRTGINFTFAGRTSEIPRNGADASWSTRLRSAEIVVAWVDQSRTKFRSNLMTDSGNGYASGVGGWMMKMWTEPGGRQQSAIGRGFVVINSGHNGVYEPGFGSGVTRGALLLHEIGHAVGLGHVGTTSELMYPTMLDRRASKYKDGDRTGLTRVGRSLGCIPGASDVWPQI